VAEAYIGLGSNLGDREANLQQALDQLADSETVTVASPIYETEPVGYTDQPWFLNCVTALRTSLEPRPLIERLQEIERQMGKVTPFANGPRVIDIDLLLYEDQVIDEPGLHVPHDRMHERRFVLAPLADVAPNAVHPSLNTTIASLLSCLPQNEQVRRFSASNRAR
jgi:2-amino-4-hydroxy-6-hydroxymethyldihydropteridine diphosphokinase